MQLSTALDIIYLEIYHTPVIHFSISIIFKRCILGRSDIVFPVPGQYYGRMQLYVFLAIYCQNTDAAFNL